MFLFQPKIAILFFLLISNSTFIFSQNLGHLPFCGGKYKEEGITFKSFEITLEEDDWISNKLPIGKKFEIKIKEPQGFVVEKGICHPGVSLIIKNSENDTLANVPNIYDSNEEGFEIEYLKSLTMSLGYNQHSKVGDTLLLFIEFFDTKSDKKTTVELSTIIVDSILPLNTTKSVYSFKSYTGFNVNSTLEIENVNSKDTLIQGIDFEILTLKNVVIDEFSYSKLKTTFAILDKDLNSIDPNEMTADVKMNKVLNEQNKTCNLIFTINKTKISPYEHYWIYRFENLKTNEVIEVFNKF